MRLTRVLFFVIITCSVGYGLIEENLLEEKSQNPLSNIILSPGFSISIFAKVDNARSMAKGPNGLIFVGTRGSDKVFAIRDGDSDGEAEEKYIVARGMNSPNGVAFRNGDLYIAEVDRILRIPNVEDNLQRIRKPEVVYDQYPGKRHHGWKYISFGPDGKLYVPVGAPCNICKSGNAIFASITRLDIERKKVEIFAEGVRNTVGFDWDPRTGHLWFTDNGRDMLGDDRPPDELNTAPKIGMHFGYPYCHSNSITDPKYGKLRKCNQFTGPSQNLGPHVAALGMKFYTGKMFPSKYRNQIFIAEHGSWNRSRKVGYRISLVSLDTDGKAISYEPFAYGWLDNATQRTSGRPVDILVMDDGSILVSDDYAGLIYRITYQG